MNKRLKLYSTCTFIYSHISSPFNACCFDGIKINPRFIQFDSNASTGI